MKKIDKRRKPSVPKLFTQTRADHVRTLTRAALQIVPLGGSIAELYTAIVGSPINDRRDEFLTLVLHSLEGLSETVQDFNPYRLAENEAFKSTLLHAVEIAIRSHQVEKKDALKNAVLNSALSNNIDENLQMMFINMIDGFTPLHIKILGYFVNPKKWIEDNEIIIPLNTEYHASTLYHNIFPEIEGRVEIYKQAVNDLEARGLLYIENITHGMPKTYTPPGLAPIQYYANPLVTNLGKDFLIFIKKPEENQKREF